MVLLLAIGCVHRSTWTETPSAAVSLPKTQVAVVAEERACRGVADSLADALASRPPFEVRPDADTRILVRGCTSDLRAEVDVSLVYHAFDATEDRRKVTYVGSAAAEVTVEVGDSVVRLHEGVRTRSPSEIPSDGSDDIPRAFQVTRDLDRDLALAFAQKIAPIPETIHRRLYKDAVPGTAQERFNQAVAAERRGDLQSAIDLALEAYAAHPTPRGMDYVETLKAKASSTGYALAPSSPSR